MPLSKEERAAKAKEHYRSGENAKYKNFKRALKRLREGKQVYWQTANRLGINVDEWNREANDTAGFKEINREIPQPTDTEMVAYAAAFARKAEENRDRANELIQEATRALAPVQEQLRTIVINSTFQIQVPEATTVNLQQMLSFFKEFDEKVHPGRLGLYPASPQGKTLSENFYQNHLSVNKMGLIFGKLGCDDSNAIFKCLSDLGPAGVISKLKATTKQPSYHTIGQRLLWLIDRWPGLFDKFNNMRDIRDAVYDFMQTAKDTSTIIHQTNVRNNTLPVVKRFEKVTELVVKEYPVPISLQNMLMLLYAQMPIRDDFGSLLIKRELPDPQQLHQRSKFEPGDPNYIYIPNNEETTNTATVIRRSQRLVSLGNNATQPSRSQPQKKVFVFMNQYKTVQRYKPQVYEIDAELSKKLIESVDKVKRDYFFIQPQIYEKLLKKTKLTALQQKSLDGELKGRYALSNGKHSMTQLMSQMLRTAKVVDQDRKNVGFNYLRHSIVTTQYNGEQNSVANLAFAKKMLHAPATNLRYIQQLEGENVSIVDESNGADLREDN